MKTIKNKVLLFALLASGCSLRGAEGRSEIEFSLHEPFLPFNVAVRATDGPSQLVMLGRPQMVEQRRYATVAELQAVNDNLQGQIDVLTITQDSILKSFANLQEERAKLYEVLE